MIVFVEGLKKVILVVRTSKSIKDLQEDALRMAIALRFYRIPVPSAPALLPKKYRTGTKRFGTRYTHSVRSRPV